MVAVSRLGGFVVDDQHVASHMYGGEGSGEKHLALRVASVNA